MGFAETYPANPESVAALRRAVAAFAERAGASSAAVDAIRLAASEAATNVIVHAYRDTAQAGAIDVMAALASREIWVIVADTGTGLRPRRESPGLGLGLGIIAQLADGVDLAHRSGGGLELRMRFDLDSSKLVPQN
jgi:anti-sigma regulatory factor (Ser/Thr protein kinase)